MRAAGAERAAGLTAQWRELGRLAAAARAIGVEDEPIFERFIALETAILTGPIRSRADALAKLRAVALCIAAGGRTDNADALALDATILWLEHRGDRAG
jgi:hypothetical protein